MRQTNSKMIPSEMGTGPAIISNGRDDLRGA